MNLFVFHKNIPVKTTREMAELAVEVGFDGYDLALRSGYEVNPANVGAALPEAARIFRDHGVAVGMLTGAPDLLTPADPTAEPILAAMAQSGVPLLKLGYFRFDPQKQDYWRLVDDVRRHLAGWQKLAEKHGVKVCYHTHSGYLGANCGMLAHLITGLDPRFIGAYLDPLHSLFEGERFTVAVAMMKQYLCAIGLKDARPGHRTDQSQGKFDFGWTEPGQGWVDWKTVAATLRAADFEGPYSVHALQPPASANSPDWKGALRREIGFYRNALVIKTEAAAVTTV